MPGRQGGAPYWTNDLGALALVCSACPGTCGRDDRASISTIERRFGHRVWSAIPESEGPAGGVMTIIGVVCCCQQLGTYLAPWRRNDA